MLLLCGSCSGSRAPGGSQAPSSPAAVRPAVPASDLLPQLPAPSTLLAAGGQQPPRRAAYSEDDLELDAEAYSIVMPLQKISSQSGLKLSPTGTAASTQFTDLAFCGYWFVVPGYDRDPRLLLYWVDNPGPERIWAGFADWTQDSWDWYACHADGTIHTPDFDNYVSAQGHLMLMLVCTGSDSAILSKLRLGHTPPTAALSATPDTGPPPLAVAFDASGSSAGSGTITSYEWDAAGDGTFETSTGADPNYDHIYTENQDYHPAVRVTNSFGLSATRAALVRPVAYWTHTFGLAQADDLRDWIADSQGNVYAVGSTQDVNYDILLLKWSSAGELAWARRYDSGFTEFANSINMTTAGELVLCGMQNSSGTQMLAQKWSTDGTLIWSKRWGGIGSDTLTCVQTAGTDIYLAGDAAISANEPDIYTACLDAGGEIVWSVYRNSGGPDHATDLLVKSNILSGVSGVAVLGDYSLPPDLGNIWKLEYSVEGVLQEGGQLGYSGDIKEDGHFLRSSQLLGETRYYITGTVDYGSGRQLFIAVTDGDGVPLWGKSLTPPGLVYVRGLCFDSEGQLVVAGFRGTPPDNQLHLWRFDVSTEQLSGHSAFGIAGASAAAYNLGMYRGGLLACGYAPHTSGTWEGGAFATAAADLDFTDFAGTGSANPQFWAQTDVPGTVSDIESAGTLDSGGGDADALLMFRGNL